MDLNTIPPTAYIAVGTLFAALIAGIFSYLNMVISKENKVSEFRLGWIDGLRNEVSSYCSAVENLSFLFEHYEKYESSFTFPDNEQQLNWLSEILSHRGTALDALTKIRLRLNHNAFKEATPEKKLIDAIDNARNKINSNSFMEISANMDEIRTAAAPILKSSWETVKKGEQGYIRVRRTVEVTLFVIGIVIIIGSTYLYKHSTAKISVPQQKMEVIRKSAQDLKELLESSFEPVNSKKNQ